MGSSIQMHANIKGRFSGMRFTTRTPNTAILYAVKMSTSTSFDDAFASAVTPGPERLLSGVALGAARAIRKGMAGFACLLFPKRLPGPLSLACV